MLRDIKLMLVANAFLSLLFVYTNYFIWAGFNISPKGYINLLTYGPGIIGYHLYFLVNGQMEGFNGAYFVTFNFPFWLFFLAIAVNMYFIFRLQRSIEGKQHSEWGAPLPP